MDWKKFLKLTERKIIVFIVYNSIFFILHQILVRYSISTSSECTKEVCVNWLSVIFKTIFVSPLKPLGLSYFPLIPTFLRLLIMIFSYIYTYFISCLIVWFLDKRKSSSRSEI